MFTIRLLNNSTSQNVYSVYKLLGLFANDQKLKGTLILERLGLNCKLIPCLVTKKKCTILSKGWRISSALNSNTALCLK